MQSGCGGGHRAALLGVDRLITFTIRRLVVAGNIRRERHVSNAVERLVEISVLVKPDASFAERASRDDFGVEFLGWPKQQLFTDVHFSARTHQALPLIRFFRDLLGQEHFDPALKEITGGRVLRTDRLSLRSASPSEEPGGKHSRVVETSRSSGCSKSGRFRNQRSCNPPSRGR